MRLWLMRLTIAAIIATATALFVTSWIAGLITSALTGQ